MKKLIAGACCLSLLAPGPAVLQAQNSTTPITASSVRTYCHTPASLPELGREAVVNQQQPRRTSPPPAMAVAPTSAVGATAMAGGGEVRRGCCW
ncbi:MAG: hypothetical protein H2048_05330, partial [Erythrobacter sp.]|nr:hypothetical protein [Erythrobacter sp.]